MKIMHINEIVSDLETEPPLDIKSFDGDLIDGENFNMGRSIIPPASRNQPHAHSDYGLVFYVVKGTYKVYIGDERKEYVVREGHFGYIPKGELHGVENLSNREAAELVYTYVGSPSRKKTWRTTLVAKK